MNKNNYGWICPKCGRVYSPFTFGCDYCNNNEIKPDPCIITPPWESDYSKYKSEVGTDIHISPGISSGITVTYDPNVELSDERLRYTTSSTFNNDCITYTTNTSQELDEFNTNLDRSIHKYSSQEQLQESLDGLNKELENLGVQPTSLDELKDIKTIIEDIHRSKKISQDESNDTHNDMWPTEKEVKDHLKYIKEQTDIENNISSDEVYWTCRRCGKKHLVFPEGGCDCGAPLEYLTYVI
jgi:hypothetical protein